MRCVSFICVVICVVFHLGYVCDAFALCLCCFELRFVCDLSVLCLHRALFVLCLLWVCVLFVLCLFCVCVVFVLRFLCVQYTFCALFCACFVLGLCGVFVFCLYFFLF